MDTKKLRQKILDLAIHGKLVPQDPNDEPAQVLLERIKKEKERLVKEGKIKKSKESAMSGKQGCKDVPFEVPEGWEWCVVDNIAYVASGSTPSKDSFVDNGIPYLKMYNIRNQKIDFYFHPQYIKPDVHKGKLKRSMAVAGDLIMNIVGPPLGKLAIIPTSLPKCNFNQAAVLFRPFLYKKELNAWLFYYLSEMSEINTIATRGSAGQVNISLTQSQNMRIPIPPINEMIKITEKLVKFFLLMDELDCTNKKLFDLIDNTKSRILDLAIHGKLVPQDPNDEPAHVALKRMGITSDNRPYEKVPEGWASIHGRLLFETMKSAKPHGTYFKYIDIDSIDNERGVVIKPKELLSSDAPSRASRYTERGDVLFSIVRPYLRNIAIVCEDDCIASTGFFVCHPVKEVMNSKYCYYLMKSNYVVYGLNQFMKGDNSPSISVNNVLEWIYPLPPYNEQLRIVSKIEELFSELDNISKMLE